MIKASISGPRESWHSSGELEWINITLELEAIPHAGDIMILDGGISYKVEACMWFVNTIPRVGIASGDKKGPGELDEVCIRIKPCNPLPDTTPVTTRVERAVAAERQRIRQLALERAVIFPDEGWSASVRSELREFADLLDAPDLTDADFERLADEAELPETRAKVQDVIDQLVAKGLVKQHGDGYQITAHAMVITQQYETLKTILNEALRVIDESSDGQAMLIKLRDRLA